MSLPPMIMRLKVSGRERDFGLWLPLFIIVPIALVILLAIFLILLPLMVIAAVVLWRRGLWRPLVFFWPVLLGLFFALKGVEVDISQHQEKIYISFK